jgi:hypothetical protein
MPEKHNDVERFVEHDLPDAVEEALAHFFDGRWIRGRQNEMPHPVG